MGKKITIQGKVHNVGYRLFLLEQADAVFMPCFDARNIKLNNKEALIVLVNGEDSQLDEFIDFVKSSYPEKAAVKNIAVEDYPGKIRDIDKFRQSFNTIQLSKIVQSGLEISTDTKSIQESISSIKEDTKYLPEIKDDSMEIKINTHRTNQLLEEKFAKLENEIYKIKTALVKAGIDV